MDFRTESASLQTYKFRGALERLLTSTLAAPRSVVVLAHATVPLVQYTDSSTGLKVDLSFNMTDGVAAAQLVIVWRRVMPALGPLLQDCWQPAVSLKGKV